MKKKKPVYPVGDKLTVLSFGGGQDSTAILYQLINNLEWYERYVSNDLIVIMSDTGDEHPRTLVHVEEVKQHCEDFYIPFFHIKPEMGYHSPSWQSLTEQWAKSNSIGSVALLQACSDQLKIRPIYKFLGQYLVDQYGCKKSPRLDVTYDDFCKKNGKIRMLLGFADGEEKRVAKPSKWDPKYRLRCIQKEFPLIDYNIDRQGAQKIISDLGYKVPPPSNCMRCFYMSKQELIWLYRNYPDIYHEWVAAEKRKMDDSRRRGISDKQNKGVFGDITIPEQLKKAMDKHGHLTNEELEHYKMNHGCVKSKF